MKSQSNLTKRVAAFAVAGGTFCLVGSLHANESTTYAPDPGDSAEQQRMVTSTDDTRPQPTRVGSMSAIGQKPRKADAQKADTATTSATAGSNQMSDMDRSFIMQAAKHGMKEVHMGQMAAQQGQSDAVKKLGRQIAADHQKANQQLMAIAARKGVKPDTRATDHGMTKRDTKNFDQAWIGMMINDHQKDVALYQRQAQQGGDPDLRNYARKTLPVLQRHLKMVQQVQQTIGSGGTNVAGMAPRGGASKSGR
jgi:putative membrane protein